MVLGDRKTMLVRGTVDLAASDPRTDQQAAEGAGVVIPSAVDAPVSSAIITPVTAAGGDASISISMSVACPTLPAPSTARTAEVVAGAGGV